MIPCDLINIKTKKRIKAKSVAEFCRLSGLHKQDKDAKIHIYSILNEVRFSHYGWCLPKYYNTKVDIKDIYGNIYSGRIRDFMDNDHIAPRTIWQLFTHKKKVCYGLSLLETELVCIPPNIYKCKGYTLETPNNKLLKGKSLSSIKRQIGDNGPTYKSLVSLKQGRYASICGYKIRDIKVEKRQILNIK